MAPGAVAGAGLQVKGVILLADEHLPVGGRQLGVAAQAEVRAAVGEQGPVDRAVGLMAGNAAFLEGFVHEHEGARLFLVAAGAGFIQPRHREPARRFHEVAAVRIVAVHTAHAAFEEGMTVRQVEVGMDLDVAAETSLRIAPGIEDELPVSASGATCRLPAPWQDSQPVSPARTRSSR